MQLIPNANDLNIFLFSNGKLSSAGSDSKQPERSLDDAGPKRICPTRWAGTGGTIIGRTCGGILSLRMRLRSGRVRFSVSALVRG